MRLVTIELGTTLGGFRVGRPLGQGAMGTVYVAEDVNLRRPAALKVLNAELSRDERFRRRFLLESQRAASLEHAHIVPVYTAGEEDGRLFLAMRLIDGRDLRELLATRHHLTPARTLTILGQIADALDAAHRVGLIHRDVKPANILVGAGSPEHPYLCDFGLAKHTSGGDSLTGERSFVGTTAYIAPEQIEGGQVDARTDQYALACVLYECLTGTRPYERESELETLYAHLREDAPHASEVEPGLGDEIDGVIARALDKQGDRRFETCRELIVAAGDALGVRVAPDVGVAATDVAPQTYLVASLRRPAEPETSLEETMREVVRSHDGDVLEVAGNEALAVFASARSALRTAIEAQSRLSLAVGIDTGEPSGNGDRGGAPNVAARLCELAGPGVTLAGETSIHLAGRADGVSLGPRRSERVDGLDEPVRFAQVAGDGAAVRRGWRGRRVAIAAVLAGLLGVAAALAGGLALRGGSSIPRVAPHALAVFDGSGDLRWQVTFDSDPNYAIVDGRRAYVALDDEETVVVVDLDRRKVIRRIPLPDGQFLGPVTGNTMWTTGPKDRVIPVDIRSDTPGKRIELETPPGRDYRTSDNSIPSIAKGAASVWVAYGSPPRVARVDPATQRVTETILLPREPSALWCCGLIAFGDGDVWVADRASGALWRIDPATNEVVARGGLGGAWVEDITAGGGYAWVPRTDDAGIWRVDRAMHLKFLPTGVWPWATAFGSGTTWVANRGDGTVSGIEPLTGETTTIPVGGAPASVTQSGDDLVVALAERPPDPYAGLDGRVATVVVPGDPLYPPDPAVGWFNLAERTQIFDTIGLRLVRFDDTDGDGVQTLVPDGAKLPVVTDGGRTWSFEIRDGYRFSPPSGAPVTAMVFRDSIERALSPRWKGTAFLTFLEDLVGLEAYSKGKASHIAGLQVDGSKLVVRLRRPLRDLAARLTLQPYSAVPSGTPVKPGGLLAPIPSAGPYYVSRWAGGAYAVLEKNPNYPGPRLQAFDAIVWRMLIGNDAAIRLIENGEADVMTQVKDPTTGGISPPTVRGGDLERRYGSGDGARYVRAGYPFVWFIRFNTLRPPFDDLGLRRAVSFAVDREEIARSWDGRPADLFIPQSLASHRPQGRVFPLDGPRLARARRLANGFSGTVTLATMPLAGNQGMAEAIKRQLARLGIDVRIVYDQSRREHASRYDMVLDTWTFDYLDVGLAFGPLLDPVHFAYERYSIVDPPIFTDRSWIARIRRAERLSGARRDAAYAKLDRDLAAGPLPIAVLGHGERGTFVSTRVGCAHAVGVNGAVDIAALCVR